MFALLDCNNFYASCERVFRPELEGKPILVLSNNDGCVIARSQETKALGVPMGVPFFQIKQLVHDHDIQVFSSNFSLYGDMSARVMQVLEEITPGIEIYSIDEAFIDCKDIPDFKIFGHHVQQTVAQWVGIPTSIGIAPTKTLAKLANYYAKHVATYKGICVLESQVEINEALQDINVNAIWGIGKQIAEKLHRVGIITGHQLKCADPTWIRKKFTVIGERLWRELNGIPCSTIEISPSVKKSIQVTRSFETLLNDFEAIKQRVSSYMMRAGQKLRHSQQKAQVVMVYIRTNRFRPQEPFYYNMATIHLPHPLFDDAGLIQAAGRALQQIYRPQFRYHKAGVILADLQPMHATQLSLLQQAPTPHDETKTLALAQAVDSLNRKFGSKTIVFGACGLSVEWRGRKESKSDHYTTSWKELKLVK